MRTAILGTDLKAATASLVPMSGGVGSEVVVATVVVAEPDDRHPARVYLAGLAPGSRRTMRQALNVIAHLLVAGADAMNLPWTMIGYQHAAAVRAHLAETYAFATANKMLAAMKGVIRQAFALGLLDAERYARILAVRSVKGTRVPKGRAIVQGELKDLFLACNTATQGGARDAALLGIAYGAGLRRSEIVGLDLADFDRRTGVLLVRGKGNKERTAYVTNGARNALETWLAQRGDAPGPIFLPVNKAGRIVSHRMTDQGVYMLLRRLASKANVVKFSPHDLRRTFIGVLLDAGADISTVQALAAHASVTTTARYDRRGERTRRRAAELLHVPFEG